MTTTNYLKNLDLKYILLIMSLMGLSGGFSILSNGVELIGKLLFSFYGLIIGFLLGFGITILLNLWKETASNKNKTIWTFLPFGIAPMFWAYFDFEEHIDSDKGLMIMLIIDLVALTLLFSWKWHVRKKLFPVLLTIPIWQLISLIWFICITWKEMNYLD